MGELKQLVISHDDFPDKLKELRQEHDLSQKEFAEKLEISQQHVSSLERGRIEPSLKILGTIAAILGVVIIIGAIMKKGGKGDG